MKKILSLLAFSMPVLAYCVQPPAETALPGTESFYRQHSPVYHYGSNALIWLNDVSIHVHVKDLITTEKVMPYLPFSEGSPSLPFVGYLQSANELRLEITVNKNGRQIKFDQTFANLPCAQQSLKFNIPSQPDASHQKQYSIQGKIMHVEITWWSKICKTKKIVGYEIRIDDLKESDLLPQPTFHEESLAAATNIPEVNQDASLDSNTDENFPLVVYGTIKKTVSFMNQQVPVELNVTPLIDKNTTLNCNAPPPVSPTEELLGFVPNKEQSIVSVKVDSPVGEVLFYENLTIITQREEGENYLSAKDSDGKEYKLEVFAAKDTMKINEATPPVNCCHIGFGDNVTVVAENEGAENNLSEPVVANNMPNIISSLFQEELVRDKIAQDIKKGGFVFAQPGFAHGGEGKRWDMTVALSYFTANTPINPEGAAEINGRIGGQYAGYEFVGIHQGGTSTELIFMINGKVEGRRVGLTTHTIPLSLPGRRSILAHITPTEIEFNMTPRASNAVYEKVNAYIVSFY